MGIKATFFVSPGRLGRPGLETWDDLRDMRKDSQDIQNHGMFHKTLTKLHGSALHNEIADASDAIEAHLGYRPTVFCYPNGLADAEVRAAVNQVRGLRIAPSTHVLVPFSKPLEDSTKPLEMIRLSATPVLPSILLELIEPYING
jgi:peptidoglycan/xylan/chitin deacetylase (PgdA/CDA1 family)